MARGGTRSSRGVSPGPCSGRKSCDIIPAVSPFDVMLLVLIVVMAIAGAIWGLVRVGAGLLGFVLAFFLGLRLAESGPVWFAAWVESPEWARLMAFFLVFFGVMMAAALVAYGLRRFLRAVRLGWADRLAGAALGVFSALVIGAALTLPLTALPPQDEPVLQDSLLAPYSLYAADVLRSLVPDELERQYREKSQALRRAWEERTRPGNEGSSTKPRGRRRQDGSDK